MKEATLEQLGLDKTNFPEGFIPRWYVGYDIQGGWGIWVTTEKPSYSEDRYWHSRGEWYEISDTVDDNVPPMYGTPQNPQDTLIRIIGEEL